MTNFEYIIRKLTDVELANLIFNNYLPVGKRSAFGDKVYCAYLKWANALTGRRGNMYFVDDTEHQPSVFQTAYLHFFKGTREQYDRGETSTSEFANSKNCNKYATPRETTLSMQVWLSKQYNPDEWTD